MRLDWLRTDLGNGLTLGRGIEFSLLKCLNPFSWKFNYNFYTAKKSIIHIDGEISLLVYKTFDEANFMSGPNWVVKKAFGRYFRIQGFN